MTEAILIEIASRFRHLEKSFEAAAKVIMDREDHYESLIRGNHRDLDSCSSVGKYDEICSQIRHNESEMDKLESIREALAIAIEKSAADLVSMQDEIRRYAAGPKR